MNVQFYLVIQGKKRYSFKPDREQGDVAVRKNKPRLNSDEIAVQMSLDIPDRLFEKPTLNFSASIPEGTVSRPTINAEFADNLADIIRDHAGVNVTLHMEGVTVDE